jgi:hypothetical protein
MAGHMCRPVLSIAARARRGLAPGPRARRLGQEAAPVSLSAFGALRILVAIGRLDRLPVMPSNQATPISCHGLLLLPHPLCRDPLDVHGAPGGTATRRKPRQTPGVSALSSGRASAVRATARLLPLASLMRIRLTV